MAEVEVTDPELLKRLNATGGGTEVTDPELLKRLNAAAGPELPERFTDPYSARSTIGRVASYVATGLPDLAIKLHNAGLNPFTALPERAASAVTNYFFPDQQQPSAPTQLPEIGPYVRKAIGVPELPENASTARNLLEGGAAALVSGGASGAGRALAAGNVPQAITALGRDVAAPTVGSYYGGAAGQMVGGDTGAVLGSLIGGIAPAARAARGEVVRAGARPDAGEIAAAAERQGVTPTAGMLGNLDVQARERQLSGRPGAERVISGARQTALDQMREAVGRAIEARQALPAATAETADISGVARAAQTGGSDVSSAVQQRLMERVGPRTPVDVTDLYSVLGRILNQTDPGTAAPIVSRMGHIRDMVEQSRLVDAMQRGGVPDPNAPLTVPYEQFKDWRTGLGRRMQNLDPVPGRFSGQVYDAATEAMRNTATQAGVHPQEFTLAQDITRNQARAGNIQEQFERTLGNVEQSAAGPRGFARWWTSLTPEEQMRLGGAQAPALSDVARLSQAYNYPTGQTGLTRAVGGQISELPASAIGAALGSMLGNVMPGGHAIGAAIGAYGRRPFNWLAARRLQGPGVRNQMLGNTRPVTIDELIAALQAANVGAR